MKGSDHGLEPLEMLVIITPKNRRFVTADMLERFGVTACMSTVGRGTGEGYASKDVTFCVIKRRKIKDAMLELEDKFLRRMGNQFMAYTVPLESVMGVTPYMFISGEGVKLK